MATVAQELSRVTTSASSPWRAKPAPPRAEASRIWRCAGSGRISIGASARALPKMMGPNEADSAGASPGGTYDHNARSRLRRPHLRRPGASRQRSSTGWPLAPTRWPAAGPSCAGSPSRPSRQTEKSTAELPGRFEMPGCWLKESRISRWRFPADVGPRTWSSRCARRASRCWRCRPAAGRRFEGQGYLRVLFSLRRFQHGVAERTDVAVVAFILDSSAFAAGQAKRQVTPEAAK
jgi:hypothetical protein